MILKAGGYGGVEGDRTPDLLIANETLYQLSYNPIHRTINFCLIDPCPGIKSSGKARQYALLKFQGKPIWDKSGKAKMEAAVADHSMEGQRLFLMTLDKTR